MGNDEKGDLYGPGGAYPFLVDDDDDDAADVDVTEGNG